MSVQIGNSVPGIRSDRTYTPRTILWASGGNAPPAAYLPGGKVIDGSLSRDPLNTGDLSTLRPGLVMGKITSGGKYAPSIIGVTTGASTSAATALTVSAATAVEIARRFGTTGTFTLTGPPSAAGTVAQLGVTYSAINTTTGTITCTAITAATVTGSLVMPNDGSQTPKVILDQHIRVTDMDGNNLDGQLSRGLVAGAVVASQILNYPADASLKTWLKTQLNVASAGTGPGPMIFDDSF